MTYPTPPEFVAQGDRVLVIGVATGRIKATNTPVHDEWVFDITVRKGKLTKIKSISTRKRWRSSCCCWVSVRISSGSGGGPGGR